MRAHGTISILLAAVVAFGSAVVGCGEPTSGGVKHDGAGTAGDGATIVPNDGPDVPAEDATLGETTGDDSGATGDDAAPEGDAAIPGDSGEGADTPGGTCTPGATTGCAGLSSIMTCKSDGSGFVPVKCPAGTVCKDDKCMNPMKCEPGKWYCEGLSFKKQCLDDGLTWGEAVACPKNQYCSSGECGISCNLDIKFGQYVGCEYWTVDLPNYPDPMLNPTPENLPHAVMVSNPFEMDAKVEFIGPPEAVPTGFDPVIPGLESRVFLMPIVNVDGNTISKKAVKVKTNRPVLVHQFNPWDNTFSNDASLLLPEPLLGTEYVVLSAPTSPIGMIQFPGLPPVENQYGYLTVVAPFDDTLVTVNVTASTKPTKPSAEGEVLVLPAGGTGSVTLQAGEVLNLQAEPQSLFDLADLTGSRVFSDKPVAVFGGHEEMVIAPVSQGPADPFGEEEDTCCADHLEEQMLPVPLLSSSYLAVKSKPRGTTKIEPDLWRIQAAENNVTVTLKPPQPSEDGKKTIGTVTLKTMGDTVNVMTSASFEVEGTGKLQVGQYLVSQAVTEDFIGDPSMILAIPTDRFRTFYGLTVPKDYSKNYATVVKQAATIVSIDGALIAQSEFQPVASSGWEYAYVLLAAGIHRFEGDAAFGLVAYGFAPAASYGYVGGFRVPGE